MLGLQHASQEPDQGTLSRTARPDDGDKLSGLKGERNILYSVFQTVRIAIVDVHKRQAFKPRNRAHCLSNGLIFALNTNALRYRQD